MKGEDQLHAMHFDMCDDLSDDARLEEAFHFKWHKDQWLCYLEQLFLALLLAIIRTMGLGEQGRDATTRLNDSSKENEKYCGALPM